MVCRMCPSMRTSIFLGFSTSIVRVDFAGKTMGLKRLMGHRGVRTKASTSGSKTGPSAENE